MKYLLDTHVWLWMMLTPERLNDDARTAIGSTANQTFLSVASAWEAAVKNSIGKLPLSGPITDLVLGSIRDFDLGLLPIALDHALLAAALPQLHKDPFDRVLIAQARVEDAVLVTGDSCIRQYGGSLLWAI